MVCLTQETYRGFVSQPSPELTAPHLPGLQSLGRKTLLHRASRPFLVKTTKPNGCTIATTEPSDKTRYKILGKYNSKAEAEKAIGAMKQC
jgi:hypothetical protein